MDLIAGARILAARIGTHRPQQRRGDLSPRTRTRGWTCIDCGGEIAEVLAALGSLRCHDCRSRNAKP